MKLIFILIWIVSFNIWGSEFVKFEVAEGRCGDGSPYQFFIKKGDPEKLLIEFMGGGVCWDYESCFKQTSILPWLHQYPKVHAYSVMTSNSKKINPFVNYTKVYLPYCTADVHMGKHLGRYKNKTVYHYGGFNIEKTFEKIQSEKLVDLEAINNLVVYGASAGGIATLVYGKMIESMVPHVVEKILIPDSSGLHWGKHFWDKFDTEMKHDFYQSFFKIGLDIDFTDGAIAEKMEPVLDDYQDWKIGFIFALKDSVMSEYFGNISKNDMKELILSKRGIPYVARKYPNISIWLKNTTNHTFLLTSITAKMKSEYTKNTVDQFVRELAGPIIEN